MEKRKRGRPSGRPKVIRAIIDEKRKNKASMGKADEVIDVNAVPVPPQDPKPMNSNGSPPLPQPVPVVGTDPTEETPKILIYRVTPENRDEMIEKMNTRLADLKNLVMAILGSGQSTLSRKEQEIVFAIMRSVDSAGLKAKSLKGGGCD